MSVELTNKTIIACRKSHKCEWCGELIEKGACAQYRSGVYDGEMYYGYYHLECYQAMINSDYWDFDDGGFIPMEQKRGKTMAESHE